jgi:solute:Na+ symporter, SSS family
LNWGASYLVSDFYRRFIKKNETDAHYVKMSRVATVVLVIFAAWISWELTSISGGWQAVLEIGAGTGLVYLLRWYWWRINAWSEISAMACSLVVTLLLNKLHPFSGSAPVLFAKTALSTTVITTIVWLIVTFATQPESEAVLRDFYRKVRPDVRGWGPIAALEPQVRPVRDLGRNLIAWVLGCGMVYLALFGLGKLIMKQPGFGALLMVGSAACAWILYKEQSARGWGAEHADNLPAAVLKH